MTPLELYKQIVTCNPLHEVSSVCLVETTCRRNGFCPSRQGFSVVDFDEVKNDFYHGRKIKMPASVDAVCVGGTGRYFCFIELKGWNNYITYRDKQKNDEQTTADGYNLAGKLSDSQQLCINIVGEKDTFLDMPVVFLLVTDIDVKSYGFEFFSDLMFKLSETSTDVYSKCVSAAKRVLDTEVRIEHDYIYCKDFDKHIATL